MILQTDLSAREGSTASIPPPSDEENLQYDSSLMLLKMSYTCEKCYEQFKAKQYCKTFHSLVDCLHPGTHHMHDNFVVAPLM